MTGAANSVVIRFQQMLIPLLDQSAVKGKDPSVKRYNLIFWMNMLKIIFRTTLKSQSVEKYLFSRRVCSCAGLGPYTKSFLTDPV